jgi:hypothetical protein
MENVKGADEKFCPSCGAIIKIAAEICPKCGVRQKGVPGVSTSGNPNASVKSRTTALLLCIFLGSFGAHRFYVGRSGLGISIIIVLLLCTIIMSGAEDEGDLILSGVLAVALGVWIFIDFIFILMGKLKDKDMKKVLNW